MLSEVLEGKYSRSPVFQSLKSSTLQEGLIHQATVSQRINSNKLLACLSWNLFRFMLGLAQPTDSRFSSTPRIAYERLNLFHRDHALSHRPQVGYHPGMYQSVTECF